MIDPAGKKVFFVSDAHLGFPSYEKSLPREKKLVMWLREIRPQAAALFLVGDIFDFWFEYKRVVPRGFTRFLGEISEFTDRGIPVHFFTGNHDLWTFDYLERECGLIIHREPYAVQIGDHRFFIAHGDGLGPGDRGYKLLKRIFRSRVLQWIFSRLHPNFSLWFGHTWSRSNREDREKESIAGEDREFLFAFAREQQQKEPADFYIFGHRHQLLDKDLGNGSRILYLGDWIDHFSYAVYDSHSLELRQYDPPLPEKEGIGAPGGAS